MSDPKFRLSDVELDSFEYHGCSSGTSTSVPVRDCIVRACAELRDRRAAELSTADRQMLRDVRTLVDVHVTKYQVNVEHWERVIAVLDRLIGGAS